MPDFSLKSLERLATCDVRLQQLMGRVVKFYDCTILEGHRTEEEQNQAYQDGRSQKRWPNSKHNTLPSKAVDVAPYPIDWNDHRRFYHFCGFVKAIAIEMGIRVRFGCDWNNNNIFTDQRLHDLPHIELMEDEDGKG